MPSGALELGSVLLCAGIAGELVVESLVITTAGAALGVVSLRRRHGSVPRRHAR